MYLLITIIRNLLFNCGILKSKSYQDVFILCVGNIRVGGTGKTPMIEYLIRRLKDEFPLAVVSLGYKRKSKGLKEVLLSDSAISVGDESKQMKEKFPMIPFFVNKNRNTAIDYIRNKLPNIQLILLDDAYQYRKTKSTKTILLTEFNRPYFHDKVIPYGRLREKRSESRRANYIVVTKCPDDITTQDKNTFIQKLNPNKKQRIFFSKIKYNDLLLSPATSQLLFIAGIDNPQPALNFLLSKGYDVILKKFSDHHIFKQCDINQIKKLAGNNRLIVTTEKDAVRLRHFDLNFNVLTIENEIDNNFIYFLKNELRKHIRSNKFHKI